MIPIEVGFRNLMSYGNNITKIPLNFKKPTLVVGRNLDASFEGQIESNGAGKTVILNAISLCLYNKSITGKIKLDGMINDINKKNLYVYFKFQGNDNQYYMIERFRKNKNEGGDGLRILRNDKNKFLDTPEFYKKHDIANSSIDLANSQIEKIIGMPFSIFSRIVLYSAVSESFFDLPATSASNKVSQIDIIEELFGLTELSEKADILKQKNKIDKEELNRISDLNDQILSELKRHEEQLSKTKETFDTWEIDNSQKIFSLIEKLNELKNIDFEIQKTAFKTITENESKKIIHNNSISNLQSNINRIQKQIKDKVEWEANHNNSINMIKSNINNLSNIDFIEQTKLFKEIDEWTIEYQQKTQDENQIKSAITNSTEELNVLKLDNEKLQDHTCPYCLQHYAESINKVTDNNNKILKIEKKLEKYLQLSIALLDEIKEFKNKIEHNKSFLKFSSIRELTASETSLSNYKENYERLINESNPFEDIDQSQIDELNNDIIELKSKIALIEKDSLDNRNLISFNNENELLRTEAERDSLSNRINEISTDKNPYETILKDLKNVDLPKSKSEEIQNLENDIEHQEFLYKLLTKKDSFIRKALMNRNLPYLNQRMKHYLTKSGLLHKVIFNYDMSTTISKFGTETTYHNLSSGQQARVNIALSFAFRDVLQLRFGKIPLCVLDECLDQGLSNTGIQAAVKMIKEIAKTDKISMLIITHRDEITSMFDSKLEIEMKNRFSNIVRSDIGTSTIEITEEAS